MNVALLSKRGSDAGAKLERRRGRSVRVGADLECGVVGDAHAGGGERADGGIRARRARGGEDEEAEGDRTRAHCAAYTTGGPRDGRPVRAARSIFQADGRASRPPVGMSPLRVLLVSYAFPPTGGAGVARVLKLAKYLPDHGVTPAVLTVSNPSVPVRDASRLGDVSPTMTVLRARTLEPGYGVKQAAWTAIRDEGGARKPSLRARAVGLARGVLAPDPQILWQPAAQLALLRRMTGPSADDVVFISAPPFSEFLLAPTVRALRGKAVVLDYRDEWSTLRESYEMVKGGLAARIGEPLERWLLRRAHVVTTATEAFRARLLERFAFLRPERIFAIPNGYDRADYPPSLEGPRGDELVVTYAGTIFRLTSARGLLAAVRALHATHPDLARRLRLRFLGRVVDTEESYFDDTERLGVERVGYVDHDRVVRELAKSHLALCLLDDVPGVERIYPAKIFELMALGRPCLTLAPEGALTELVRTHGLGTVLPPRDVGAIVEELRRTLAAFVLGSLPASPPAHGIERYERRRLAGEFAEAFRLAARLARGDRC